MNHKPLQQNNHGLNWDLELSQRTEKDWVFGATSPVCMAEKIPQEERELYLPKGEVQQGVEDTMDCATRGPINMYETKFNYLYRTGKLDEGSIKFLHNSGYITDKGEIEFSDAFIAILSGTTREGNSMKAPLEAVRLYGLVPKKLLPLKSWMTWEDYHKPERITEELENLGQEFLKYFNLNYERVYENNLDELLERDIIDLAGFAWPDPDSNGEYPRVDYQPNHVFIGVRKPRTYIFDNYLDVVDRDFIKKLASDYDFVDYGYRVIISEKSQEEPVKKSLWQMIKEFWEKIIKIINEYLFRIV